MIAALLLAAATPAFQNVAALDRAVAAFTGRGIGDEGGARAGIDQRLRLQICPTVALSWRTAAHDAVVVACSGPDWRLFVPVRAPPGLVAASPPAAAAAAIVRPVKVDPVIRRGDPVVIEAGSIGFAISREGVAMGDAAPGARFMVRVDDGKAPVQAMALASGRATLPGWTE
jgi:flagella basal body P-ring formation protein FlgA